MVFTDIMIPIYFIISVGYLSSRALKFDVKSVNTISLYILSPALVFTSILKATVTTEEFWGIVVFGIALVMIVSVLAKLASIAMRLDRVTECTLLLSTVLMNTANYGFPVVFFFLGDEGLQRAAIISVVMALLGNTLGVYYASLGRVSWRQSFNSMLRLPILYAALLAGVLNVIKFSINPVILEPVVRLSQAAIPVILLSLGMQLARLQFSRIGKDVAAVPIIRLIISPLLGFILVYLLGLQGITAKTAILEAAMPTAVFSTVLAVEFNVKPEVVSMNVFLTTLLSAATLPVLFAIL